MRLSAVIRACKARLIDQKLTSGEFQKQHEILIASCKYWGEMECRLKND